MNWSSVPSRTLLWVSAILLATKTLMPLGWVEKGLHKRSSLERKAVISIRRNPTLPSCSWISQSASSRRKARYLGWEKINRVAKVAEEENISNHGAHVTVTVRLGRWYWITRRVSTIGYAEVRFSDVFMWTKSRKFAVLTRGASLFWFALYADMVRSLFFRGRFVQHKQKCELLLSKVWRKVTCNLLTNNRCYRFTCCSILTTRF